MCFYKHLRCKYSVSGRLSECFGEPVLEGAVVSCKMWLTSSSPGESWWLAEPTHLHCPTWLWSGARPWAQAPLCPQNTKRWHWGGSIRGIEGFQWQNMQILFFLFEPSHFITFSLEINKTLHNIILSNTLPNHSLVVLFKVRSEIHFSLICVSGELLRRNGPLAWSSVGRKWFFCWSRVLALWLCGCGDHCQYSYSCSILFSVSDQKHKWIELNEYWCVLKLSFIEWLIFLFCTDGPPPLSQGLMMRCLTMKQKYVKSINNQLSIYTQC